MSNIKVRVRQICRVTRETVIEVEADSVERFREMLDEGEYDLPNADDSAWVSHWDLIEESAEEA